jgi:hypothetical protein
LLLLRLERFADAKHQLVERLETACRTLEEDAILRLGAAFSFIMQDEYELAQPFLDTIEEGSDFFTRHLRNVLELHLAVAAADNDRIEKLAHDLESISSLNEPIKATVYALRQGKQREARSYTIDLLLSAA